jgi:hypothetical protein
MKYLNSTPQEQLAYAWAVAESAHKRLPTVSDRVLTRCREATHQLSTPDCLMMLSEVPALP